MQLGLFGHNAAGPGGIQPAQDCHVEGIFGKYASNRRSEPMCARAFLNLTGGAHPLESEADRRAPRPSSSTSGQRGGGELIGVAVVNGEAIRAHRLARGGVAVRVEVEAVAGV